MITKNGEHIDTTNAAAHGITGFAIGHDRSLTILDANSITAGTGAGTHPIDMAFSNNNHVLYVNNGDGTVGAVDVHAGGGLSPRRGAGGLPTSATGMARK